MIVKIKNLKINAFIGVHKHERIHRQEIIVNIALEYDSKTAAASDNIHDAVDYELIAQKIADACANARFALLETLVNRITGIVMEDARITKATVEADKPQAILDADSVSLTHTVSRG
ncbi:MAG: dihydroneopterin aldolase [Candidatus Omnitrophota bacterium]